MTDLKYSILGVLYSKQPRRESILNLVRCKFDTPVATDYAIKELIAAKFINPVLGTYDVELTPTGATAYEQAVEERQRQAENKRQQRFNNKISVASVLIPLITFFLGILVESQANIVGWVISIFR